MILENILQACRPTPVVRLSSRVTRGLKCRVLVKVESFLPSGTSADRIAAALAQEALDREGAPPTSTLVVPAPSGNLGLAMALAAAVRGHRLIVTVPDRISPEKVEVMKALGAKVKLCPASVPADHPDSYLARAAELAAEVPGAVLVDPALSDAGPRAQAESAGKEIFDQLEGKLDILVAPMESGATVTGVGRYLKERIPGLKVIGAEPEGSIFRDFVKLGRVGKPGTTLVEGAGAERIPGALDASVLDEVIQVSDPAALRTARKLARQEGILTGGAGGLAVAAALEAGADLPEEARVLALLPDTGLYYVSRIYNEAWMQANQILGGTADRTLFDVLSSKKDDPGALISITPDEPLAEAIARMKRSTISQLPVLTREGTPVGSLWEAMVIDILVQGKDTHAITVREVMAEPFPIMEMETPVTEAIRQFGPRVPAILVRRRDGAFAIITKHDLLQGLTA